MENNYTPEQILDIRERERLCLAYLKENGMTPAAQISKINLGEDTFADKVQPYLQDIKYTNQARQKPARTKKK